MLVNLWLCIQIFDYVFKVGLAGFARLFARLDRELAINLTMSINLILFFIVFLFSSFSVGTEKVMYFWVFSPRHSNCPSSSHSLTHCRRPPKFL